MGKILLDSASFDEVQKFCRTDAIAGVTTNPTLAAKHAKESGYSYEGYMWKLAETVSENFHGETFPNHFSVEVLSSTPEDIVKEARRLKNVFDGLQIDLFVKIPVTLEMLPVISSLARFGINVNATACMKWTQAKLAADAGAAMVSFFFNRMKDGLKKKSYGSMTGVHEGALREISNYLSYVPKGPDVICGSIRSVGDIEDLLMLGVHNVTCPAKFIEEMMVHPETDIVLKQFEEDAKKCR